MHLQNISLAALVWTNVVADALHFFLKYFAVGLRSIDIKCTFDARGLSGGGVAPKIFGFDACPALHSAQFGLTYSKSSSEISKFRNTSY